MAVTDPQKEVYGYLRAAGYHPRGAAAIVGNLVQESGVNLDPALYRKNPDYSHGVAMELRSGGIAEWMGSRKTELIAFGGDSAGTRKTQVDFIVKELRRDYPKLDAQLRAPGSRTIENMTANFQDIFERPNKKYANLDGRIRFAKAIEAWASAQSVAPNAGAGAIVVAGGTAAAGLATTSQTVALIVGGISLISAAISWIRLRADAGKTIVEDDVDDLAVVVSPKQEAIEAAQQFAAARARLDAAQAALDAEISALTQLREHA